VLLEMALGRVGGTDSRDDPEALPRVVAPNDDREHAKSKGKQGKKHGHGGKGNKK